MQPQVGSSPTVHKAAGVSGEQSPLVGGSPKNGLPPVCESAPRATLSLGFVGERAQGK